MCRKFLQKKKNISQRTLLSVCYWTKFKFAWEKEAEDEEEEEEENEFHTPIIIFAHLDFWKLMTVKSSKTIEKWDWLGTKIQYFDVPEERDSKCGLTV